VHPRRVPASPLSFVGHQTRRVSTRVSRAGLPRGRQYAPLPENVPNNTESTGVRAHPVPNENEQTLHERLVVVRPMPSLRCSCRTWLRTFRRGSTGRGAPKAEAVCFGDYRKETPEASPEEVSNIQQTEVSTLPQAGVVLEHLKSLQREYDENAKQLAHPFDLAEFEQLKERREIILYEARALARTLNISEPRWLSLAI
jgi:hypothetical protein